MIKFKVFVVWRDGDSSWFTLFYHSYDEFVEFNCKHYNDMSEWIRVVAFQDKENPNQQVLEYLGDFFRLGNEVQFVKPIEQ